MPPSAGLSVPRDWTPSGPRNAIQDVFGTRATHPAVAGASPRRFQDAGVLVGRTKAFGPELLAGSILSGTKVLRGGVPVRLGRFESLLYDDLLSNDGRRRIELFVVPTSRGIVTVACYAPVGSADTGALEQCGIVAETLQISAGSPFRLGARPEYERFLNSILRTLLTREQTALTDLRSATTRSGQHAAAMALADAYSAAAASFSVPPLGTLSPAEGGIHFLIRDSLLRVRDAYRQLAAAGATGRRKQFRAAKRGVLTAVNQLGAGLDELTKLGFVMS